MLTPYPPRCPTDCAAGPEQELTMKARADDAGPNDPVSGPSRLVEHVLGLLENYGAREEECADAVRRIEALEWAAAESEQNAFRLAAENAALRAERDRLRAALEGLMDGLEANGDPERCGLSQQEWDRRIAEARAALAPDPKP
jgi:hypothetical protein